MLSIDDFIKLYDKDNKVKCAIIECLSKNMNKEIALDILTNDLEKHLHKFLYDEGSNVRRDFNNAIKDVLTDYFSKVIENNNDNSFIYESDDWLFERLKNIEFEFKQFNISGYRASQLVEERKQIRSELIKRGWIL